MGRREIRVGKEGKEMGKAIVTPIIYTESFCYVNERLLLPA